MNETTLKDVLQAADIYAHHYAENISWRDARSKGRSTDARNELEKAIRAYADSLAFKVAKGEAW